MRLPTICQYIETVANPEGRFATIGEFEPERDPYGEIKVIAGNNSAIFKIKMDGRHYRLKCYTREISDIRAKIDYFVDKPSQIVGLMRYRPNEMYVHGHTGEGEFYDVALSEWIEGKTMAQVLRRAANMGDKAALEDLANHFDVMALDLLNEEWAHGDVKPENIMVDRNGWLYLIDFDAVYIPSLKGRKSSELGTPPFQHPMRDGDMYDKHIDDYSLAMISFGLHYLAEHPEVFHSYDRGDNIFLEPVEILEGRSAIYKDALDMFLFQGRHALYYLGSLLASPTPRFHGLADVFKQLIGCVTPGKGLYPVREEGRWGYRNAKGEIAIPIIYEDARPFCEELAPVRLGGLWSYIDSRGKVAFSCPGCRSADPFSEGLAAVNREGLWGYVDRTGRQIIPAVYQAAGAFREGLASAKTFGKYGFLDPQGHWAIPPRFEHARNFHAGRAEVTLDGGTHIIDKTGAIVEPGR